MVACDYKYPGLFWGGTASLAQDAVEFAANGPESGQAIRRTKSKPTKKMPASTSKWLSHGPMSEPLRS